MLPTTKVPVSLSDINEPGSSLKNDVLNSSTCRKANQCVYSIDKRIPKTSAERAREYRARKKLLNGQSEQKNVKCAKTSAERSREYRMRKRLATERHTQLNLSQENCTSVAPSEVEEVEETIRINETIGNWKTEFEDNKEQYKTSNSEVITIKNEPLDPEERLDLRGAKEEMTLEKTTSTSGGWLEQRIQERDHLDIFGELVICKLRRLPTDYARSIVQHLINNILYEAELGMYNEPVRSTEPCSSSSVHPQGL